MMSLTIMVRPMTEEERERLTHFSQPGLPLLAWLGCLILVPTVGGGLVGFLLMVVGFDEDSAYAFGLVLGFMGGIYLPFAAIRENRRDWADYVAAHRAALTDGVVHQVSFTPQIAWEVDSVEDWDFGPAYLFDTGTEQAVFMYWPDLPYSENGELAIGHVAAEVVPHTDGLIDVMVEPGATPCHDDNLIIEDLKLSRLSGLVLLPRTVLPRRAGPTSVT